VALEDAHVRTSKLATLMIVRISKTAVSDTLNLAIAMRTLFATKAKGGIVRTPLLPPLPLLLLLLLPPQSSTAPCVMAWASALQSQGMNGEATKRAIRSIPTPIIAASIVPGTLCFSRSGIASLKAVVALVPDTWQKFCSGGCIQDCVGILFFNFTTSPPCHNQHVVLYYGIPEVHAPTLSYVIQIVDALTMLTHTRVDIRVLIARYAESDEWMVVHNQSDKKRRVGKVEPEDRLSLDRGRFGGRMVLFASKFAHAHMHA
jgi:hypothetical protein